MYARIVERTARRAFEAVNGGDYDTLIDLCREDVVHRFGGDHALGGTRHTRDGLRLWFERFRGVAGR